MNAAISDYPSYRDYVIIVLPQLEILDGREITRTDRFKAQQIFFENRREIIQLQVSKKHLDTYYAALRTTAHKNIKNEY